MRFSFLLHAYFKFFGFSNVSGRLNKLRASRNRALVEWTNTKQKPQIGKQNIEMEMERGMYIVPDSIYRSMFWYFILKKILFLLRKTKKYRRGKFSSLYANCTHQSRVLFASTKQIKHFSFEYRSLFSILILLRFLFTESRHSNHLRHFHCSACADFLSFIAFLKNFFSVPHSLW